jgi:hypothetical protein
MTQDLVVRLYKTPPRYGIDMSQISRHSMQYALLVHVVLGFFMFSNTVIFSDDETLIQSGLDSENQFFHSLFSPQSQRLSQPHAKIYCVFMILLVSVFALYKFFDWVSEAIFDVTNLSCSKLCKKCTSAPKVKKGSSDMVKMLARESAYSANIYEEMTIDDLKKEYHKTKNEKYHYRAEVRLERLKQADMQYLMTRLDEKTKAVKKLLNAYLKEAKISKVLNTIDAFDQLFPLHKADKSHRMRQLYSYDVRDSEMFRNTFKAEERIQAEV